MTRTLALLACVAALTAVPALANEQGGGEKEGGGMMMEMWNTLSKEQKLKFVEANHAQRQKEFQARWDSMSADEKIAKFEQHMAKRGGGAGGKRSGGGEGGMGGKQREGGPMGGGIERPHAPQSPEMP